MINFRLKKKIKKLSNILLIIVISFASLIIFNKIYKNDILEMNKTTKNAEYQTNQTQILLEEENLSKRKNISREYISNLSFSNDITLLKKFAQYERLFDTTNYSNSIYQFFTKKKISWLVEYKAILSIPFTNLNYYINDNNGNVCVAFDKNDIELLSLDITNTPIFATDNSFLRYHSNEEIIANLSIITKEIKNNFLNNENLKNAETSLIKFILADAITSKKIDTIEINGTIFDLTDSLSNELILNEVFNTKDTMEETQKKINNSIETSKK